MAIAFPYVAATAGWILTEMGRQPWIVQDLLKTSDAISPNLSTATIATSLACSRCCYLALGVVDFVLMRRYARVDPPLAGERGLGADRGRPGARDSARREMTWTWRPSGSPESRSFWAGYFLLEGFDFGVGMLLPALPRTSASAA